AACVRCHTSTGFATYAAAVQQDPGFQGEVGVPVGEVIDCTACHGDAALQLRAVPFPSGQVVNVEWPDSPCMACHQGRSAAATVDGAVAAVKSTEADTPDADLRFVNIHYTAAAATLLGAEVRGAYEYPGETYRGRNRHVDPFDGCVECHHWHTGQVRGDDCRVCHYTGRNPDDRTQIRMADIDYDGDGDTAEGISGEIATMSEALYAEIQAYAAGTVGTPIGYDVGRYPYFFVDDNADGLTNQDTTRYNAWTPRLLRAAYNYHFVIKDRGAFAHNPNYVLQILFDALDDLGGNVRGLTRP
ncbi:MAG TPA: polyheme membrane-associated cytochrome C, partial [Anaerolineae bacterium]|nr:polyheme membrane-associated cytochrome C [Anaerolineae bacterium]